MVHNFCCFVSTSETTPSLVTHLKIAKKQIGKKGRGVAMIKIMGTEKVMIIAKIR